MIHKKKTLCVVKRQGRMEAYDERKVYGSVYAAALNCEYGEKKSEKIAARITKHVTHLIKNTNTCMTSHHIRHVVIKALKDKDVALMYKTHLDVS